MTAEFFTDALSLGFFQRALLAGCLTSIVCGILGSFVVVKRFASISGGLAHAAFGGIGIGFALGIDPLLGATGFCLLCSVVIGLVYRRHQQSLDTLVAMVWSVGMAVGILLISLTPGFAPNLNSYLFGSILFVPKEYLYLIAGLDVAVVLIVVTLFKEFQAISFDEEFAEIRGLHVDALFVLLLSLTALVVVALILVVGVILTIALLTTPAVIGRQWSKTLPGMMVLASLVSALSTSSGLFLSYALSVREIQAPTGPLIIIVVTGLLLVSSLVRRAWGRR